jgi:DNA-binding MarR family transcriptional regulator
VSPPRGTETFVLQTEAGDRPLALLHFAFRAIVAEPDAKLATLGLGRVHHRILFFIVQQSGLRVVDLVATLGVTKQALNGPLRELVRQGFVNSLVDSHDLRERNLSLSARGKALERELSGAQRRAFAAAFRRAGPGAKRAWQAVMLELIRASSAPPEPRRRPQGDRGSD